MPDDFRDYFGAIMQADPPDQLKNSPHPEGVTIVETGGVALTAVCRLDERGYIATAPVRAYQDAVIRLTLLGIKDAGLIRRYQERLENIPAVSIQQLAAYASEICHTAVGRIPEGINFYQDMQDAVHTLQKMKKQPDSLPGNYSRNHLTFRRFTGEIREAVSRGDSVMLETLLSAGLPETYFSRDSVQNSRYAYTVLICSAADTFMESSDIERRMQIWCEAVNAMHSVPEIQIWTDRCLHELVSVMKTAESVRHMSACTAKTYLYVQQHVYAPMNIQMLAEEAGVSRNTLASSFKKETGISLHDFIVEEKLAEAYRLLKTTDYSGSDIASMLSFSSQSHFISLFRQKYGCTPENIRRQ